MLHRLCGYQKGIFNCLLDRDVHSPDAEYRDIAERVRLQLIIDHPRAEKDRRQHTPAICSQEKEDFSDKSPMNLILRDTSIAERTNCNRCFPGLCTVVRLPADPSCSASSPS